MNQIAKSWISKLNQQCWSSILNSLQRCCCPVLVQVRTGVEGRSRDLLIPKSHVEPGAAEEGEGINPYQRQPQGRRGGFKSPASEGLSCSPGREDLLPSLRRVVLRSSTGWVGLLLLGVEPGHKSCSHPHERATLFLLNLVTRAQLCCQVVHCHNSITRSWHLFGICQC